MNIKSGLRSAVMLFFCASVTPLWAANYTLFTEELPPYSMRKSGGITGASVDIVAELFKRSGLSYEIKLQPFARAVNSTKTTPNTCVFPIERNQEREVAYKWISPILITQTAFYTLDDSKVQIRSLEDVAKLTIGTYNGSAPAEYLSAQGFQVQLTPKDEPNIKKLQAKRMDVWAADTLTAPYLARAANVSNLKERLVYFSALRALACNMAMEDAVVDRLEQELKSMYADGTIEKIMAAYR